MNKLWPKMIGFSVLAIVAIVLVNTFWLGESHRPEERTDQRQAQLRASPAVAQSLYQEALTAKEQGNSSPTSHKLVVVRCRQLLSNYPESPLAEKAREPLEQVPKEYREGYREVARPTVCVFHDQGARFAALTFA